MRIAEKPEITGKDLYHEWQTTGKSKAEIAADHDLTYGMAAGRIWRYEQERKGLALVDFSSYNKLSAPWLMDADNLLIAADVQIPTTRAEWVDRVCMVGSRHLPRPRKLIIAGDLVNMDGFSGYDPDSDEATLSEEVEAARQFFRQILTYFDEVRWFWGNHERRATRRTNNVLKPYLVGQMILGGLLSLDKVKLSHWGYMFLNTSLDAWIVAHGKNYSVNQLVAAEKIAHKFQRHVVLFHEHHLAHGYDRYKHFQIINGGGLFDQSQMSYSQLDASGSANMQNGFVLFKNGYPHVLGPDGYTDWSQWIPDRKAQPAPAVLKRVA